MITSQRLFLMPATLPILEAMVQRNWNKVSDLLGGVYFADNWNRFPETVAWTYERIKSHPDESGWWMYIILHGIDARVAGICGYKGKPNAEGEVEIGYEIADRYQEQGLASEAAEALVKHAFGRAEVEAVVAHTLPEESASTSVLKKLGFVFEETVADTEGGLLWRWRIKKKPIAAPPLPKPAPKPTPAPTPIPTPTPTPTPAPTPRKGLRRRKNRRDQKK